MEEPEISLSLRQLCKKRPKEKLAKLLCQDVESHLPRLVSEGHLSHTLVTVLPDPTEPLLNAWRAVIDVREQLRGAVASLPGMCFTIMALEVHGGSRPKKRKPEAAPATSATDDPMEEETDPAAGADPPDPASEDTAAPKGMQGKPHFHLLLYYPTHSSPQLDESFAKRELKKVFPKADINQVHQRAKSSDSRKRCVGAMTYVLKGVDCPVRKSVLELIHPTSRMINPTMILGSQWEHGSTPGMILRALVKALAPTIDVDFDLDAAPTIGPHYESPSHKFSKETTSMLLVAEKLRALKVRISGNSFYRLRAQTRYTYELSGSLDILPRLFAADDTLCLDICVRYASKLHGWYRLPVFDMLPDNVTCRYLELRDALYDVQTGSYLDMSQCDPDKFFAFAYYDICVYYSIVTEPTQWLKLIRYQYAISANPEDEIKRFIDKMALLLRPRRPKEKIMFINGVTNSGKSTVIGWITRFFPRSFVATINDSVAPLSAIKGASILVCDEFSTNKISRSNLLLLTDGTTGLTVRAFGRGAEYMPTVDLPQIYTCNFGHEPAYKNDDSGAVMNRFEFFRWERQILTTNLDVAQEIYAETPYVVFYLNRVNTANKI